MVRKTSKSKAQANLLNKLEELYPDARFREEVYIGDTIKDRGYTIDEIKRELGHKPHKMFVDIVMQEIDRTIAFEYHGEQHFALVGNMTKTASDLLTNKALDEEKSWILERIGIPLVSIPYDMYLDAEIIENLIYESTQRVISNNSSLIDCVSCGRLFPNSIMPNGVCHSCLQEDDEQEKQQRKEELKEQERQKRIERREQAKQRNQTTKEKQNEAWNEAIKENRKKQYQLYKEKQKQQKKQEKDNNDEFFSSYQKKRNVKVDENTVESQREPISGAINAIDEHECIENEAAAYNASNASKSQTKQENENIKIESYIQNNKNETAVETEKQANRSKQTKAALSFVSFASQYNENEVDVYEQNDIDVDFEDTDDEELDTDDTSYDDVDSYSDDYAAKQKKLYEEARKERNKAVRAARKKKLQSEEHKRELAAAKERRKQEYRKRKESLGE